MERNLGILLVNKEKGSTSFRLVSLLRKMTGIQKIGHAGTLDPFATGLMVMLIGREFTRRSNELIHADKEYEGVLRLGVATDTYDLEGKETSRSDRIPTLQELTYAIEEFQGEVLQVPPMYSAKKVKGKKLYELARKNVSIERAKTKVHIKLTLRQFVYPEVMFHVECSKGTYIRSLAHELGQTLGTGAHLTSLTRIRSGSYFLQKALPQACLYPGFDLTPHLL